MPTPTQTPTSECALARWLRGLRSAGAAALIAFAASGCGDDGTGPPEDLLAPLVGTWEAESVVVTSALGSADFVSLGGAMRIVVEADGGVTTQTREPGASLFDTENGTIEVLTASRLRLDLGDGPILFDYSLNGDLLTFVGPGEIDVDDDGLDDPVSLNASLRRQ